MCSAIKDLLESDCVIRADRSDMAVCSSLGVVDNGKKLRMILDLRFVKKHLAKFKFKLEDLKTVANVYRKGDFLVTFDLKSGHHHLPITKEHWKYLGFSWEMVEGRKDYFMLCVLPFGLSSAPYIFTKVTRVLLRSWREAGIRCQLYMDAGWMLGREGMKQYSLPVVHGCWVGRA